jgi:O-antigen/teichoic acid export membrane protein
MCAAAGGVFFFSYEILLVWTQSPDLAAQTYAALSILAAAMMLNGMMSPVFSLILAAGVPIISLYMNAAGFVVLVPLTYFLVKVYGLAGAASAALLFNCAYYLVVPWVLASKLPLVEVGRFYVRDTLPYALLAITAFGAGKYLSAGFGIYATLAVATLSGFLYLLVAMTVSSGLRRMARDSVTLLARRRA